MRTIFCLLLALSIFSADCLAGANGEVDVFWGRFRKAVIENNVEEVITLTGFPFEVRGATDTDPVVRYDSHQFPAIFIKLCSQRIEVQHPQGIQEKTMRQAIKDKKVVGAKDYLTSNIIRVHQFVFQRIKGKWLLVRAYSEE